jgi:hypothetical protein
MPTIKMSLPQARLVVRRVVKCCVRALSSVSARQRLLLWLRVVPGRQALVLQ